MSDLNKIRDTMAGKYRGSIKGRPSSASNGFKAGFDAALEIKELQNDKIRMAAASKALSEFYNLLVDMEIKNERK